MGVNWQPTMCISLQNQKYEYHTKLPQESSKIVTLDDSWGNFVWYSYFQFYSVRIYIFVTVYCTVSMFYDTINFLVIKNEWMHFTIMDIHAGNCYGGCFSFIYLLLMLYSTSAEGRSSYSLLKIYHIVIKVSLKCWRYYIRCMCLKIWR